LNTSSPVKDNYLLATYKGEIPAAPAWFKSALKQAPNRSHLLSAGANIELLTWGARGKPGLLFLHGNGAHADWWSHIAPFFAADWRCAALSWSGMGRSDRRPEGYNLDIFAQEAKDAAHAAGLFDGPTSPVVISHSLGGLAGMAAASSVDNIFGGLVVIDSPIKLDLREFGDVTAQVPKARAEHYSFGSLEEGLARFRFSPAQACDNDFIADHIARHALIKSELGWQWHFDPRGVRVEVGSSETLIDTVKCPAAFIYGERSSMLRQGTLALSLAALPVGTPVIAIPDAGHHVMIDQPLALICALRALLTSWPN